MKFDNYDDEMLQEINQNADLISYVKENMQLEQRGNDYFTNCPLHTDLTPSLSFTPSKNSYYCFSCGKSGGAIGYFMDFEGMKFEDAVEKAAKLANLDLSAMCHSPTISFLKRWKNFLQLSKSEKFQHQILKSSEFEQYKKAPITEWLNEGIQQDVMDYFDIRIDDISNRIVYPVYDIDGNLINIKGRTRYENYKQLKLSKYMNYKKVGVMDYFQCLEKTLPYIREKNEVIIFESIKSVLKCFGWNYKNCVSAEKHTLTPEQIALLVKMKVNVTFAYDVDVSYNENEVKENINKLRRVTNVYIINDTNKLLGGKETKNAPVDCGLEIWEELYQNKRKVV